MDSTDGVEVPSKRIAAEFTLRISCMSSAVASELVTSICDRIKKQKYPAFKGNFCAHEWEICGCIGFTVRHGIDAVFQNFLEQLKVYPGVVRLEVSLDKADENEHDLEVAA